MSASALKNFVRKGEMRDECQDRLLMRGTNIGNPSASSDAATRDTGMHQADGPVGQVISLPGALGYSCGAKQSLCDHAIAVAFDAAVERTPRRGAVDAVGSRTGGASIERPSETTRGNCADFRIIIERQFGRVVRSCSRPLAQP
jgi:hypothetical protein